MVSQKVRLKARAAALSGGAAENGTGIKPSDAGVTKQSRRQRKLGKQLERASKKRQLVEREISIRKPAPKKEVLALEGLGNALAQVETTTASNAGECSGRRKGGVSARARKHRVREESEQVASVLAHPAFQADPVEALRQHLLNSVCGEPAAVPPAPSEKANKGKAADKKVEKKKRRAVELEVCDEAMEKAQDEAKERLREKRQRKEKFARAAQAMRKKAVQGVSKVRASPHRGRIGVKRPKLLE